MSQTPNVHAPTPSRRVAALGALVLAVIVLTLAACGTTTAVASGTRAPFPTATPVPTPRPVPTPTPTPVPAPTPAPIPEPAEEITDQSETAAAARGARQFASIPTVPDSATPVPVRAATDPDARVWSTDFVPIVEFIEATTGMAFRTEAPVVSSVDQSAMVERLTAPLPALEDLDPDVAEAVRRVDDVHRALGIAGDSFDILAVNAETAQAIQGVFTETTHEILIRSEQSVPVDSQPIDLRATIVHEVAHAWQGRDRIAQLNQRATDQLVAAALIEGEAEWISQTWLAQQSDQDRADYQRALAERSEAASSTTQPTSLIAEVQMQYELGRRLYSVARSSGLDLSDVSSLPLVDGGSLLDPWGWADGTLPRHEQVSASVAPPGLASLPDIRPPANPGLWLQVLATGGPYPGALEAARAITSTTPITNWIDADGRTCFAARLTTTVQGLPAATAAFGLWADRLPDHRTVVATADGIAMTACDPGTGAVPLPLTSADRTIVTTAAVIDVEATRRSVPPEPLASECVAAIAAAVEVAMDTGTTAPFEWATTPEIASIPACLSR